MIGMWAVLALALVQTPDPKPIAAVAAGGRRLKPAAETALLLVDREADDEAQGSLRWAVTTSNAEPGRYRIEIVGRRASC
jgi:3-dehydroshikimate dehydratase